MRTGSWQTRRQNISTTMKMEGKREEHQTTRLERKEFVVVEKRKTKEKETKSRKKRKMKMKKGNKPVDDLLICCLEWLVGYKRDKM